MHQTNIVSLVYVFGLFSNTFERVRKETFVLHSIFSWAEFVRLITGSNAWEEPKFARYLQLFYDWFIPRWPLMKYFTLWRNYSLLFYTNQKEPYGGVSKWHMLVVYIVQTFMYASAHIHVRIVVRSFYVDT